MLNTLKKFALTLHVHGLACMHAREYARHLQGINQFPRAQSCPLWQLVLRKKGRGWVLLLLLCFFGTPMSGVSGFSPPTPQKKHF